MSEKFDENKWRILAMNKPDELHSYVPQSSINELFDEIERLEKENFKLKEANEDVQSRLDDYRQDYATVVNDQCPTDERHCGCVPILRRENRILSEDLANAKDELKHRRDTLVDAQNIYGDFFDKAVIALGFSSATLPTKEAEEKLLKRISDLFWLVRNLSDALDCVYGKLPAHWRELPFSYHELKRKVKEVRRSL